MMNTRTLGTLDRMLTLNRALDQAFNGVGNSRVWVPALDVAERGDAYVVHAELPGVSPDQVDVQFEQNVLTIRGTKPASFDVSTDGELRVFAAERVHGGFERSVRLPEFVDAERIEATFTNGLLSISPNDVAKIEVLKDISQTAYYGVRGANGVVVISTKRAKK